MGVLFKVGVPVVEDNESTVQWSQELGIPDIPIDMGGYTEAGPTVLPSNTVICSCGAVSDAFRDLYKQVVSAPDSTAPLTEDKLRLIAALPDTHPDQSVAGVFQWLKSWGPAAGERFGSNAVLKIRS